MKKSFPDILRNLKNIRATIKDFLKIYEIDLKIVKTIQLAVDEAVTNIIKHSYKEENENNIIKIELEFKKYFVIKFENIYLPKSFLNLVKSGLNNSILCKTINLAAPFGKLKVITNNY